MTAPNPLVAERQDSTTAISGIGIAESAVDIYGGISSGSWVEGGLGMVGGGLETLGLVIDPVGTLVSYGVAWLMEHVKPLSDALDWLAGDPDSIASYAQTWRNVAQAVGQARTDFDSAVSTDTAAWTGAAGDAYRAHAASQSEHIAAASTAADTVGTVVEVVGVLVGVVREIVRDLVAECVATLIARIPQWLAEIAATLGLATPHVVASAVSLISRWVARISEVITKLVRSVENLRPLLRRLDEIWEAVRGGVRGLGDAARHGPNGSGPASFAPESVRNPSTVDTPTMAGDTPGATSGSTSGSTSGGTSPASPTPDITGGVTAPGGSTPGTTAGTVSPTPTSPDGSPVSTTSQGAGAPPTTSPTPATPVTPTGAPSAPSTPITPAVLSTPSTPSTPGTPATPGAPSAPGTPTTPGTPMSADDFNNLPTDQKLNVAQSEVDQGTHTFADNADAQQYGSDYWNDYADTLPADQRQALFDYTSDPPHYPSYVDINGALRGTGPMTPEVQAAIDRIDGALAGRPVPEDLVVSRGTGLGHIGMSPQDMVGRTFREDAYLSTSLGDTAGAFSGKDAVLHMRVPEGTPAIWVERVGAYGAGERELLLGRGLEYRVDRVVFAGGQWHVYGEYLPVR